MPRATGAAPTIEAVPMPGDDADDTFENVGEKSMEDWLLEAGAKRNSQGQWYRVVPDPKTPKKRVVENGKVYLETTNIRRPVAVGASWEAALELAKRSNGAMDALIPGIGWVRGGYKIEKEHPDNVGNLAQLTAVRSTVREEIDPEVAAAEQAVAMRPVLDAVASGASRSAGAGKED